MSFARKRTAKVSCTELTKIAMFILMLALQIRLFQHQRYGICTKNPLTLINALHSVSRRR